MTLWLESKLRLLCTGVCYLHYALYCQWDGITAAIFASSCFSVAPCYPEAFTYSLNNGCHHKGCQTLWPIKLEINEQKTATDFGAKTSKSRCVGRLPAFLRFILIFNYHQHWWIFFVLFLSYTSSLNKNKNKRWIVYWVLLGSYFMSFQLDRQCI